MDLHRVIEALLFATDRPLTPKAIVHALKEAAKSSPNPETGALAGTTATEVEAALTAISTRLESEESGLMVQAIAGGYLLKTRPEFGAWTARLFDQPRATRLSQPALETLAVIAYRQPIGRAEIEAVRGVAVDGVMATLMERKVVRIAGRSEQPGRPLLYETTPRFLELFGLQELADLPNAGELRRISSTSPTDHAPEQQQFEVDPLPANAELAGAVGSDRPSHPEAAPATD